VKPTDEAPDMWERECAGRNDEMNDRLRPRKKMAPSAEPAQYWRRQQAIPDVDQGGAPLGGVKATARAPGHGLKQGRAPRPAEKSGGSKVAARAERRSAAKARAWRMGPYERRSGVTPAERRGPTEGIPENEVRRAG